MGVRDPYKGQQGRPQLERRLTLLFNNRSPVLVFYREPDSPVDQDIWIRADLNPVELRVRLDGFTWRAQMEKVT